MHKPDPFDREYLKSKFRCPICGQLAGCTKDGKINPLSTKKFHLHVDKCRRTHGVKPDGVVNKDENRFLQ
jgi:hypothetical protein